MHQQGMQNDNYCFEFDLLSNTSAEEMKVYENE